jgi:hypothetical protein
MPRQAEPILRELGGLRGDYSDAWRSPFRPPGTHG